MQISKQLISNLCKYFFVSSLSIIILILKPKQEGKVVMYCIYYGTNCVPLEAFCLIPSKHGERRGEDEMGKREKEGELGICSLLYNAASVFRLHC